MAEKFVIHHLERLRGKGLSLAAKAVYIVLEFRQGKNGSAWPGVRSIAADAEIDKTTVVRAVRELETAGLIVATREQKGRGTSYSILPEVSAPCAQSDTLEVSAPCVPGVRAAHTGVRAMRTGVSAQRGPNSTSEQDHEQNHEHDQLPAEAPKPSKKAQQDADFAAFWEAYPKKVGKKAARKAWDKAKDRPDIDTILVALAVWTQTEQWTKDSGQFIPNPTTWINQGRWDDEPPQRRAVNFQDQTDDQMLDRIRKAMA